MALFENLQLFRDLAQNKSLSKAAELSGITPSAVTQHLQELERTFSIQLVDRSKRPLELTPAGQLYAGMCRDVLRRRDEFASALDDLRAGAERVVRVASIYSVGLSEMSRLEEEFLKRRPGAELAVDYLRPERVYEAVASERVDLGLVSYPEPTRDIAVIPWRREEMALITAPGHPLTLQHRVRPQDLQGAGFVAFDEDLPIRRAVDNYFSANGVEVNVTMHFDNLQMIKEAVAIGSGVSIAPARIVQAEVAAKRLVAVPLASPGLQRPLGIIHKKRKRFDGAAQAFLNLLRETPAAV